MNDYHYDFPKRLIAQAPASPRDAARLLVYDRKTGERMHDTFLHLDRYLPPNAVLVFNETKVIPARLRCMKETGGSVELLYLSHDATTIRALANKPLRDGQKVLFSERGGAESKSPSLPAGRQEQSSGHNRSLFFTVLRKEGSEYILHPSFPPSDILTLLNQCGETPLPPYMKDSPLAETERRAQYQTIFAKHDGSVAAPTASLHFTKRLLKKLEARGIGIAHVTLHVGLGTFASVTPEQFASGVLHHEQYSIDPAIADFLNEAKAAGRPIIAVGTTVVRTLESAVDFPPLFKGRRGGVTVRDNNHPQPLLPTPWSGQVEKEGGPRLAVLSGSTTLFIRPGYTFRFIDGMITNFHVPDSSLLMLVAAFIGRETLFDLYRDAIAREYRLFSFGDGLLLV